MTVATNTQFKKASKIMKFSNLISGIDTETLMKCPRVDQLTIGPLGLWLVLTFCILFGLNYFGLQSLFTEKYQAALCAFGIGATIYFADRAIIQWSWYANEKRREKVRFAGLSYFGSSIVRVLFSLTVASFVGAFFLQGLFAGRIDQQIVKTYEEDNKDFFDQRKLFADDYAKQTEVLSGQVDAKLALQKDLFRNSNIFEKTNTPNETSQSSLSTEQTNFLTESLSPLNNRMTILNQKKDALGAEVDLYLCQMGAEDLGVKDSKCESTGKPKKGKAYNRAKTLKETAEANLAKVILEINAVEGKIAELQSKKAEWIKAKELTPEQQTVKYDALDIAISALNDQIKVRESEKAGKLKEFEASLKERVGFHEPAYDLMSKMIAWNDLRLNPKFAGVISWTSFSIALFIMALEMLPILIKLWAFPDTLYGVMLVRQQKEFLADLDSAVLEDGPLSGKSVVNDNEAKEEGGKKAA
jgi:hypothetical protein